MNRGLLGGFPGFDLAAVMDEEGCFIRWATLPGNARETRAKPLVTDLSRFTLVLGNRGSRRVGRVKTPPYRLRGGQQVETDWKPLMGRVRNWIETRFSVLMCSFGLHRLESKRFLVPSGPGEPHRAGAEPGTQPRAAQDCGGGVVS